jgi:cbb3-type cytochrome oxidase subunit 3
MKARNIFIAAIILVLLGAYYYAFEVKKKAEDEKAKASSDMLLPGFDAEQVGNIYIKNSSTEIQLKKKGEDWIMEKPLNTEGDRASVDGIMSVFLHGKFSRKLEKINPADFGLDTPQAKIIMSVPGGSKYEINFGIENPADGEVYASKAGDPGTAYMVPSTLRAACEKTVFEMRYKKPLDIDGKKTDRIVSNIRGKEFTLVKDKDVWKFVQDSEDTIRQDRVGSLINTFTLGSAKSMETAPAGALSTRGLSGRADSISFFAGKKEARINFGNKDPKKHSVYAKNNQTEEILELPENIYDSIPKPEELVDGRVSYFDESLAYKVQIKCGGKNYAAEKKAGGKWEISSTDMDKKAADGISPETVVYNIAWMEYRKKTQPAAGADIAGLYGITHDNNRISIFDKNGTLIGGVEVGKITGNNVYVRLQLSGRIYEVNSSFVKTLNIPGMEVK